MQTYRDAPKLVTEAKLESYFHNALKQGSARLRLDVQDDTLHYLTCLLSDYSRSDRVFDNTDEGVRITPLALLYGAALEAKSRRERQLWLQRLGDVALFVAGLFSGRLSRRFHDLDYCIAMGGNAYGYLQQSADVDPRSRGLASIFGDLSRHFERFVDLVATVGECGELRDTDLLRLYEAWRETGDPTLERQLIQSGLVPAPGSH